MKRIARERKEESARAHQKIVEAAQEEGRRAVEVTKRTVSDSQKMEVDRVREECRLEIQLMERRASESEKALVIELREAGMKDFAEAYLRLLPGDRSPKHSRKKSIFFRECFGLREMFRTYQETEVSPKHFRRPSPRQTLS